MTKKFSLSLCALSFLLSGCDVFKEKEKLTGNREAVLALDDKIQPTSSVISSPNLPNAEVITSWTQSSETASHTGHHYSLSQTPAIKFKTSIGSAVNDDNRLMGNLVATQNTLFAMDAQGKISALNSETGSILWAAQTSPEDKISDTLGGGVALEGTTLVATTSFGEVIAFNTTDGTTLWRQSFSTPIRTAPTIHKGIVYFVTLSNELIALDIKSGKTLWTHSGIGETSALLGGASPAVSGSVVITAYSSGEVCALHADNGHLLWTDTLTATTSADSVSSIPDIVASPVIDKDVVFVISHGGRMTALDLKSGVRLWQKEIGGIKTPTVIGDSIFVIAHDASLLCLNKQTGDLRWAVPLEKKQQSDAQQKIVWSSPLVAGGQIILTGSNGQILFLSPKDGKKQSLQTISAGITSPAIIVNKTLYTLTNSADLIAWQ
jgi:outer membrane protein assembly factor BamB